MTAGEERRYLIVNADDFGRSDGINRGVIAAVERGIVTSASLMVRWPAAPEAAAYAARHPEFSLGLHVDLGESSYRDGQWYPLYTVVEAGDGAAVKAEVERQLAAFRRLAGMAPTHLDSHQHVHRKEPLRSLLVELAASLGVPLRQCDPRVTYRGDFYGQMSTGLPLPDLISAQSLAGLVEALPAGVTELGCHPAEFCDFETMYAAERPLELAALCDPGVRVALRRAGVQLCSFRDLAAS